MATYSIYKETALPGTLQPNSIYLVAPAGNPDYVEMYVTGVSASTVKRIIDQAHVQQMIDNAITGVSGLQVVANIAARNALAPTGNAQVLVLDATGDPTVTTGSATYVYVLQNTSWVKIAESESQDVIQSWANIQNKPTSLVVDIDDAVTKRHNHTNKTQLDKIGESGGQFTYNGSKPTIDWTTAGW